MNARAARYQRLVEEAAEQLNCGVDSELARHVGTLRLARETFAERIISGRDVNPADLVRLDDALRQYWPAKPEPPPEPLMQLVERQRERADRLQLEMAASTVADRRGRNGNGNGGDRDGE
jgi:alpha-D-ribose 1-methylphosphonate 5-triphosphate synthase subunit PhnG